MTVSPTARSLGFESWANSVIGFTDLICGRPADMQLLLESV